MRAWLFLGSLGCVIQIQAQISVYDCGAISQIVTQSEIEAANNEYYKQCIMFIPPETYEFNGSLNRKVTAATNIHLREGVHIGPFTQDGQFWLQIKPKSDFDVAVMNYENLNNVLKFEKLELGISLPQDVLIKVNNFVNEASVPNEEKLNPYLDWELRVETIFISPLNGQQISIDGFYTRDYDRNAVSSLPIPQDFEAYTDAEYVALGEWVVNSQFENYPFRVRFAPPHVGKWKAKVRIHVNEEMLFESNDFIFQVIQSNNPGYVNRDGHRRYMRYNNKTFYPIGCNLPWPETDRVVDPELWDYLCHPGFDEDGQPEMICIEEGYRSHYSAPRVYDKYKERLVQLIQNGGNYFRTIMYPTSTEIEWEKLGDYTERLHMAQELDDILEIAEQNDVFLHWNFQIHYNFQESEVAYNRQWSWDKSMNGFDFCYKQFGTETNPMGFFTDQEAKKYFKQKLRYILSRYGYSTSIGAWELISEINNIRPFEFTSNYYKTGNNWQTFRDWQVEMANYVKSLYHGQIHLLTSSYGEAKVLQDNTFNHNSFDLMSVNGYDYQEPSFASHFINEVSKKHLNESLSSSYSYYNEKPMIFSEGDPLEVHCWESGTELKRAMWQSMFSGLAGYFSWDLRFHPDLYPELGRMKNFISQFELEAERWHPGASKIFDFSDQRTWIYKDQYAKYMDGQVDPKGGDEDERIRKADLSFLRSWDGNYAIGVITNRTRNIETENICQPKFWPEDYDALEPIGTVDCEVEELKLNGMNGAKYFIDYFETSDLSSPNGISEDYGPKVKIEFSIGGDIDEWITLIKVRRKDYSWSPLLLESTEHFNDEAFLSDSEEIVGDAKILQFILYPNPAKSQLFIGSNTAIENHSLKIISTDGKTIYESILNGHSWDVDISNFEIGFYIVTISQANKTIETFKIVKE
jgi:hypothetical protein